MRSSNKAMGGLQTVLVGDFLQLPPVPNHMYMEPGARCFRCPLFYDIVPHTILLAEVGLCVYIYIFFINLNLITRMTKSYDNFLPQNKQLTKCRILFGRRVTNCKSCIYMLSIYIGSLLIGYFHCWAKLVKHYGG